MIWRLREKLSATRRVFSGLGQRKQGAARSYNGDMMLHRVPKGNELQGWQRAPIFPAFGRRMKIIGSGPPFWR